MIRQAVRTILVIVLCLALVIGFISIHPTLHTQAASLDSNHSRNTSQIICGQWNRIPNGLNHSALSTALFGVSGISLNDAWAVGFTDIASSPINRQPFTMHWNGIRWKSVLSPTLSGTFHILHGVAAISSNDVWAVGEGSSFGGQALMEHWDGSSWSEVSAPLAGVASILYSVAGVPGTNELWAVGYYSSNNSDYVLLEHWDGTQWTVFSSPSIPSNNAALQSVTAFSSANVWAVGWLSSPTAGEQTLIEHWDGVQWSVVSQPASTLFYSSLWGIAAVPNQSYVWAVGYTYSPKIKINHPLIMLYC